MTTNEEYDVIILQCRKIFEDKLQDYGASWRVMRVNTVNDQLFIKVMRIREIETTGVKMIEENIESELKAIINYSVIGILQARRGFAETPDMRFDEALRAYDELTIEAKHLMQNKNHDYDEAWRTMCKTSFTDIILTKVLRNKTICQNNHQTRVSEGVEGNFFDMLNYAVFYLIQILEENADGKC